MSRFPYRRRPRGFIYRLLGYSPDAIVTNKVTTTKISSLWSSLPKFPSLPSLPSLSNVWPSTPPHIQVHPFSYHEQKWLTEQERFMLRCLPENVTCSVRDIVIDGQWLLNAVTEKDPFQLKNTMKPIHLHTIICGPIEGRPLVLVHGWGAAGAVWVKLLAPLALKGYRVYALDLLGWGLSSRLNFSALGAITPEQVRAVHVTALEAWRRVALGENMKIHCLLGHSMGGYITGAYACQYGERIHRLCLLSPIGIRGFSFPSLDPEMTLQTRLRQSLLAFAWRSTPQRLLQSMPTQSVIRLLGQIRGRLTAAFPYQDSTLLDWLHAQTVAGKPTGAQAFTVLLQFPLPGWTLPLIPAMIEAKKRGYWPQRVTWIYGLRDWIDASVAYDTVSQALNEKQDVRILERAGHHGYAEADSELVDILTETTEQCYAMTRSEWRQKRLQSIGLDEGEANDPINEQRLRFG